MVDCSLEEKRKEKKGAIEAGGYRSGGLESPVLEKAFGGIRGVYTEEAEEFLSLEI